MDKKPLIATEPSLILLDDCAHPIEKLPNLPILLYTLLTSHTNMDANSTDDSTNAQDTTLTKELTSAVEKDTTPSSPDIKPQEETATDPDKNAIASSDAAEPGDTTNQQTVQEQDSTIQTKEVSPQDSARTSSPVTTQEETNVSADRGEPTGENQNKQSPLPEHDQSESTTAAEGRVQQDEASPAKPVESSPTPETKDADRIISSSGQQPAPVKVDSLLSKETDTSPKEPNTDDASASAVCAGAAKDPPPSAAGQETPMVADQSPVDKPSPPTSVQSSPSATTSTQATADHASSPPQEPAVTAVPEVPPSTVSTDAPTPSVAPTSSTLSSLLSSADNSVLPSTSNTIVSSASSSVPSSANNSVALSANNSVVSSINNTVDSSNNNSVTSSLGNTVVSLAINSVISSTTNALASPVSTTTSPVSVISSAPISLPAHVPVVKSAFQKVPTISGSREQAGLITLGAEKLTVAQAETLQSTVSLLSQQKQIEMKTREEVSGKAPPQIAVIPPIIDPSKSHDLSRYLVSQQGQGVLKKGMPGHDPGTRVTTVEKTFTVPQVPTSHREGRSSDSKSPHPVARRIWMSSCRPLDPASLERIGVDSKGNVYWYDGGKNMFMSPASTNPAYKPSESELQLVCKSMVQWTAKLKELRMSSDQQADIKLAQTIKDQFMSRVRVATQRKPRDVSVLQNLQAVHSGSSIKQTQLPKQQHIITMASTDSSKTPQFVQSAFPQGSILVVPHGGSPFHHTVLPIFGSTAMIMPQQVAGITAVAGKEGSAVSLPTATSGGPKVVTAAAPNIVIQPGSSESAIPGGDDTKAEGEKKEEPKPTAVVLTTDQAKSFFSKQSTINMPMIVPPSLAGGVLPSVMQNYQQAFAFYSPAVYPLKVGEPVKMEDYSFDCKSIEISGEVPIRKVLIDKNKEESSEDVEVTDSVADKSKQTAGGESKPEDASLTQPASFAGHSSAEVMSARLLLSLTGRSDNWSQSQDARVPLEQKVAMSSPLTREEAMAISTPVNSWSASSSGRKRKQTPIASAKPSVSDETPSTGGPKVKRGRKIKSEDDKVTPKRRAVPKKNAKSETTTPNQPVPGGPALPPTAEDIAMETSQASANMLQLKASRVSKPMKEYVIETDSDSDSSSSGSSANSESSSESSSDSSSEEEVTQQKKGVAARGRGRGRGRGGRGRGGTTPRAQVQPKGSSDESNGDLKKTPKTQSKRGGRGSAQTGHGRGGTQKKPVRKPPEHIVSIPTDLINSKQVTGKKRKSVDGDPDKLADGTKKPTEFTADTPTDLASLYAKKGGVDLSILSELTQSVGASGEEDCPSRSKRTCVRVREQITKLQEILGDEAETRSPGSAGSKVKGRGTGKATTNRTSDGGQVESSVGVSPKKYKRPAYSQFTHKRRKRKKKPEEEEALWQPAQQPSGEKKTPVYVFSTNWANKAAAAVENGVHDNIIKFHKAQPKGPGYLTLESQPRRRRPPSPPPKEPSEEEKEEDEAEPEEEKPPPNRGQRGKAKAPPPKKSQSQATRGGKKSSVMKSPPIPRAFLRSSSRLRKQRNEPEPEEFHSPEESSSHHTPSPSPPPPPPQPTKRTRASTGSRISTRTTRSTRRRQLSPESFVQDDSESDTQSPVTKANPPTEDKDKSEEEASNKKARLDNKELYDSPVGSSPDNLSKPEPSATKKDEVNYTICHGTPGDKTAGEPEAQKRDTYPRPKGPLPVSSLATTTPSETVLSPEMSGSRVSTPRTQYPPGTTEQRPPSKGIPTDPAQAQREPSAWNPNIPHQFPGVPPGYPSVYNPALHGMPYPAPAAPGIHGSNYPYPMPYPWPPGAHSQIGASQDPSRHSAHTGEGQQFMRGGEANSSPGLAHGVHVSTAGNALQQQQHRQQLQSSRPAYTPDGQGIQKAPGLESPSLSHSPSLHPLSSPVSGSSPLAHQATHGFTQSPSSLNPDFHFPGHNHPSHPPHFPYGFEHSAASLQQMHLWQSQQPHLSQFAGIRSSHIPGHMSAPGLWYSPTQPMPHFMPGGEIPSHYKKPAGKTAKPLPPDKAGANRNANNNNSPITQNDGKFLNIGPHLAKYQAKAFPGSTDPQNGSTSSLESSQHGAEVAHQQAVPGSYSLLNKPY